LSKIWLGRELFSRTRAPSAIRLWRRIFFVPLLEGLVVLSTLR
jgi:hypothetical protein